MHKMIKYLKKSWVSVLAVIVLLALQATCDLALPGYTSDIVNVGIQQQGIAHPTPTVARVETMARWQRWMSDEDQALVDAHYRLLSRETLTDSEYARYVKAYPALAQAELLLLQSQDAQTYKALNGVFSRAISVEAMLFGTGDVALAAQKQMRDALRLPEDANLENILAVMPDTVRVAMRGAIQTQMAGVSESMLAQAAVPAVKDEYTAIGMNASWLQTRYMLIAGAKMLAVALLSGGATVLVGFLAARVAALLGRDLRGKLFAKVVSFSNAEMDQFSTASLITRSTNDIQQISMALVMMIRMVFYAPILGVGGAIRSLQVNTSMGWIIALAVMIIITIVTILFSVVMPRFKLLQKLVDKLNLVTREILTGLPVIRAFSTQKHEEQRFDKANLDLTRTHLFVGRVMSGMMPLMMLVMNGITLLIMWRGAYGIDAGVMQVGDLMAFIQYTMQIIMAFLMISMLSIMLPRASVSAVRVEEVLSSPITLKDPQAPARVREDMRGLVEFDHVSFRYPNAEADVLHDISFTARPGKTTAVIGGTGCGKSTLVNLIPRFYDVTSGTVRFDGVDVRQLSARDLRSRIGYVPQKGVLFTGTIASNIRYGAPEASDEAVREAARIAQAASFIEEKGEGYESSVSQGGTNVSGGQKQRLAIARAIAIAPEVYIFDDSFSAVDYKTDVALRRALNGATAKCTSIIVAQRISTIMHADQIIVLDEGRIVGKGTHQELIDSCEVYQQIAATQLSKEELAQ